MPPISNRLDTREASMAWTIYFWAIAAWLVIPVPFKIAGYVSGKDESPTSAKIEEAFNSVFFLLGLVGLYGFVYDVHLLTPAFWKAWVVLAVVITAVGLIWLSPKIRHATAVMGTSRVRVLVGVSFLVLAPMLVGVWQSGA